MLKTFRIQTLEQKVILLFFSCAIIVGIVWDCHGMGYKPLLTGIIFKTILIVIAGAMSLDSKRRNNDNEDELPESSQYELLAREIKESLPFCSIPYTLCFSNYAFSGTLQTGIQLYPLNVVYRIVIPTAWIKQLRKQDLIRVATHEMGHLVRNDGMVRLYMYILLFISIIVATSWYGVVVSLGIFYAIGAMARYSEYQADAFSARHFGELEEANHLKTMEEKDLVGDCFRPKTWHGMERIVDFFSRTHPTIESRILKVQQLHSKKCLMVR